MSVTVTPMNAPAPVQAVSTSVAASAVKQAGPLFCDLAENTSTPIPSLAGC